MDDVALWQAFVSAIGIVSLGLYYTVKPRVDEPPPIKTFSLFAAMLVAVALVMAFAGQMTPIYWALNQLRSIFTTQLWHWFGLVLAVLIYTPLIAQACRRANTCDIVVIIALLILVLLLFLPGGFDGIGEYELWPTRANFEGRISKTDAEVVSRFWVHVPYVLPHAVFPASFAGFHLVNMLMFWGQLACLYGIFRKLGIAPLFAFLTTTLFLVYPVNSHLMSLRSYVMTYAKLSLLAAVVLVLDYWEKPSRLKLFGIWLALLFNIGSYESGFVIILVVPLLWWWRGLRRTRNKIHMTIVWYLAPALKAAYVLLLWLGNRKFYGANQIQSVTESNPISLDAIPEYLGVIDNVYRQTAVRGWREAFSVLFEHPLDLAAVAMLVLTGATAFYLSRGGVKFPPRKRLVMVFLVGCLLILPAISVIMWLESFNRGMWRMYVYVPIGAAIVLSSAILLLTSLCKEPRLRTACIVALHLIVMLPTTARLREQQAHFENSADSKAKVLLQIVELAPSFDADAHLILMTDMPAPYSKMKTKLVSELRSNMFDSAVYMLYGEGRPAVAYLCPLGKLCSVDDIPIDRGYLEETTDFSDIVLFRLNEDLSVDLLRELPAYLAAADADSYNPDRLIDFDAPILPRALTMLASVRGG